MELSIRSSAHFLHNNTAVMLFTLEYLDVIIHILIVLVFAELLRRIYRMVHEYIKYRNHYLPNLKNIISHIFRPHGKTSALIIVLFMVALVRFGATSHLIPPKAFLITLMPCYWLCQFTNLSHSTLSYSDFIRERNGLDYAEGMASSFFHGYLKLIVPSDTPNDSGICSRIEHFEAEHNIQFAFKKLVIIIPDTLYVSPTIESKILERSKYELLNVVKNRAGIERKYKNDVYRLTRPVSGSFYYVALEGATPLQSFFDSLHFNLSRTWQMETLQREILLKFYKSLYTLINDWPETQGKVELIFYKTKNADGSPQDIGEIIMTRFLNQREHNK